MTKSWRHEKSGCWPLMSTATTNELVDYFLKRLTELAFGIRLFALVLLGLCLKKCKMFVSHTPYCRPAQRAIGERGFQKKTKNHKSDYSMFHKNRKTFSTFF